MTHLQSINFSQTKPSLRDRPTQALVASLLISVLSYFPSSAQQKSFTRPRTVPASSTTNTYENFRKTFGDVLQTEQGLIKVMEDLHGKRVVRIDVEDPLMKVSPLPVIEGVDGKLVTAEEFLSRRLAGTIEIGYPDSNRTYRGWVDTSTKRFFLTYDTGMKQFALSTAVRPADKNSQRQLLYREARRHLTDCFPELPVVIDGASPRPKIRSSEMITHGYYRPCFTQEDSCVIGEELLETFTLNTPSKLNALCVSLSDKYGVAPEEFGFYQEHTFGDIVDRYAGQSDEQGVSYLTHLRTIVGDADLPDCLKSAYQGQQIVESHLKHSVRHSRTGAQGVSQRMSGYAAKMQKMFSQYAQTTFGRPIDKANPLHTTAIDMRYYEERYRAIKYGQPYPKSVITPSYSFRLTGKGAPVDASMWKYITPYQTSSGGATKEKYARMFLYDVALYHQTQQLYKQYPHLDPDMVITFLLQTGHVRGEYALPVFLNWILDHYQKVESGTHIPFEEKLVCSLGSYDGTTFDTKERLQRVSDLFTASKIDKQRKDQTRTYATRSWISADLLPSTDKS